MWIISGRFAFGELVIHLWGMKNLDVSGEVIRHEYKVRVQYADTDRMDMVYHGTYARFLEAARVEMLRDLGFVYAELEASGVLLPVVQLNMGFKKPARYDEVLSVFTRVVRTPTSRLDLSCQIECNGSLLVDAEVILVFVNRDTGKPMRAPKALVEAIERSGLLKLS